MWPSKGVPSDLIIGLPLALVLVHAGRCLGPAWHGLPPALTLAGEYCDIAWSGLPPVPALACTVNT